MRPFDDKTVLVTGGSRGIGAAVVARFAQLGARVAIGYREREDAARRLADTIEAAGGAALPVKGDLAREDDIEPIVARTLERFGGIDILVNCAAVAPYRPLESIDAAHIREIFDANVMGAALITKAVAPHLPSPGGRIIHFSSRLAYGPIPTSSIYAASKAAVIALVQAFSKELGPRGITVNAVAPGVIETDMTLDVLRERGAAIRAGTPLGRIGQPDDIAGVVTFLASPEAGWITGRTILADGGFM
jgi:3-oxoacyl-[acyl-carrier protein] reductase